MPLSGWRLSAGLTLAIAGLSAGLVVAHGADQEGVRAAIRATARTSLVLFLLAFVARPLRSAWRTPASAWLLRNRRYAGLAFAGSQAVHVSAIAVFAWAWPEDFARQVETSTLVFGGVGYAFTAAMAATSSDGAMRALGRTRWRALHASGMWTLWVIFLATFVGAATARPTPLYLAAVASLALAVALRAAVWWTRRRGRTSGATASA